MLRENVKINPEFFAAAGLMAEELGVRGRPHFCPVVNVLTIIVGFDFNGSPVR